MAHPKSGYHLKNGKKVPGVTTIIGRFKDSGGLLWWAFEQGKAAERGEISSLYDKRDMAADAGTAAHAMVEAHIKNDGTTWRDILTRDKCVVPEGEVLALAKQGYENYIRWSDDNRIVVVYQEIQLVSEQHEFGGCPDAIGMDNRNETCLLDWKTSSSGPYVDWLLQLGAYDILWTEHHPAQPITGGYHLCRFSKDNADFHHHYWNEIEDAKNMFLLLKQAYGIGKRLKKRV